MILFADTSYWVALSRAGDTHRQGAIDWQKRVLREAITLLTSEGVLWETLNSLSAAHHRGFAFRLYQQAHHSPRVNVIGFEPDLCDRALQLYAERSDKSWGVVDCFSFVVMKHFGIDQALTSDRHFEQAGFTALLRDTSPSAGDV